MHLKMTFGFGKASGLKGLLWYVGGVAGRYRVILAYGPGEEV